MIFMNFNIILNMKEEIDDAFDETRIFLNCLTFCRFSLLFNYFNVTLQLVSLKSFHVSVIHVHFSATFAYHHHSTDFLK